MKVSGVMTAAPAAMRADDTCLDAASRMSRARAGGSSGS